MYLFIYLFIYHYYTLVDKHHFLSNLCSTECSAFSDFNSLNGPEVMVGWTGAFLSSELWWTNGFTPCENKTILHFRPRSRLKRSTTQIQSYRFHRFRQWNGHLARLSMERLPQNYGASHSSHSKWGTWAINRKSRSSSQRLGAPACACDSRALDSSGSHWEWSSTPASIRKHNECRNRRQTWLQKKLVPVGLINQQCCSSPSIRTSNQWPFQDISGT